MEWMDCGLQRARKGMIVLIHSCKERTAANLCAVKIGRVYGAIRAPLN